MKGNVETFYSRKHVNFPVIFKKMKRDIDHHGANSGFIQGSFVTCRVPQCQVVRLQ